MLDMVKERVESKDVDPSIVELVNLLIKIGDISDHLDDEIRTRLRVHQPGLVVLKRVWRRQGQAGITVGLLRRELGLDSARLSGILNHLESIHLVKRSRGRDDARIVTVIATKEADQVLRLYYGKSVQLIVEKLVLYSSSQIATAEAILEEILDASQASA